MTRIANEETRVDFTYRARVGKQNIVGEHRSERITTAQGRTTPLRPETASGHDPRLEVPGANPRGEGDAWGWNIERIPETVAIPPTAKRRKSVTKKL